MNDITATSDREIIDRYLQQPARLPEPLRRRVETDWGGERIELYALSDLDSRLAFRAGWLCLGRTRMTLLEPQRKDTAGDLIHTIRHIDRSAIRAVRVEHGNVCHSLRLLTLAGDPALATVRYTSRQRAAFDRIRFALEEALEGRRVASADPDDAYAASVARPVREAQSAASPRRTAVLWRLLGYLRPYRRRVVAGTAAAALITLLSLIPPYVAAWLIDDIVGPVQAGTLDLATGTRLAWIAVAAMALVHVLRQAASWVRLRLMFVLGELVARDLRRELYAHMQTLSVAFFSRRRTGGLITRVSSDTDRLWEFLAVGIIDASLSVLLLIGLGVVLVSLDWRLGLVMVLPVPLLCIAIFRHGERLNRLFLSAWRKWSHVTDVLSDTLPGIRVVKAFGQEGRETGRFDARNQDATSEFNRIHRQWTSFWPTLLLVVQLTTVAVWAFAVPRLIGEPAAGAHTLSSGTFVAFLLYMTMFIAPIEVIGQLARIANRATSSAHRVFEILDTRPDLTDAAHPLRLPSFRGHIRLEAVTFCYDGARPALRNIDLEVRPGETIGLVGPSGGGKSTLINLLARFHDVTDGRITIDGVDVRELDSGWYRRQIGMVLQEPYLFFGTIAENIRYGQPAASESQVVAAAIAANAHDFICRLEHGYETMVGERGHTLSGGERQRISIARAILRDPALLLLDEATASVDTQTERRIQQALDRLAAGRTVVAIAHRLSTLNRADRIVVIDRGRVIEQGTHAELLAAAGGTYRRLHGMQSELARGI